MKAQYLSKGWYLSKHSPMKPVKFGRKMFVLQELCSASVKDPTNPPYGYYVYTDRSYTSPQLADELLVMNMVTRGTVMPSRKEMPEPLKKKEQNREDEARGCAIIPTRRQTRTSLEGQMQS
jgi:hypothetical protein